MIIKKALRPSSRLKVKLTIVVCTCIAGFTTSQYKLSYVNHMDTNVTGLHCASPRFPYHCVLLRAALMLFHHSNRNVNTYYLYLITVTMTPFIFIKALTPGDYILLCAEGLQTAVEMPLCICASSLRGAAYIFHRRWVCHYLKGDFPAAGHKEASGAVSSGGLWTNMAAWGLFYVTS